MSVDVLPMTSPISINSVCKYKRDRRKKSRLKRWSRLPRVRRALQRELTILPTRKTLTYAEAQKFVDVLSDGQVHRLNISDSVEIETSRQVFEEIANEQGDSDYKIDTPTKINFTIDCKSAETTCTTQPRKCVPFKLPQAYLRCFEKTADEFDKEVEYDVDEEDIAWLKLLNDHRKTSKLQPVCLDDLEIVLDRLEKEAHLLTTSPSFHSEHNPDGGTTTNGSPNGKDCCCVCRETSESATNSILVCDSCGVSVHQDCYGVPYYPGDEWLCRKCLKSPNSSVQCCLCPCPWEGEDGPSPMKQTTDGRWVHVVCALFIPEISFGSNLYLEPVEMVDKVPKWRYDLKCRGCNKSNQGACLSCHAPSCPHSFHVPCAIRGGCSIRPVDSSSGRPNSMTPISSKRISSRRARILFCPEHLGSNEGGETTKESEDVDRNHSTSVVSDPDASLLTSQDNDLHPALDKSSAKKQKPGKRSRKSSQLNNSVVSDFNPLVPMPIPNLNQESLVNISSHLTVRDRQQVMMIIHKYWLLKRHSRQGFPLIQRLQQVLLIHHLLRASRWGMPPVDEESMKSLKKLRQDYEKVRLLLELIRKRERLKVDELKMKEAAMELMLQPFNRLLRHTVEQLKSKDAIHLFHFPVTEEEAPGYRSIIEKPMDYSTMSTKIDHHQYQSIDDFMNDFELIISNCFEFNGTESPFYKIALKHKKEGSTILESAKRMCERANFCPITGLHADLVPPLAAEVHGTTQNHKQEDGGGDNDAIEINVALDKDETELKRKLRELHDRLDVLNVIKTKGVFHQVKLLRKEISLTKRRLTCLQHQQDDATPPLISSSDLDSSSKISEKTIAVDDSKRNFSKMLDDELTQSDATILEKCFDDVSSQKRPRLSSDATDVMSASSLSSTTVIAECATPPLQSDLASVFPTKLRSASRRNRLASKTNVTDFQNRTNCDKMHSTPESIEKIKASNSSLSRRLSFISPVRREAETTFVSDENREPPPADGLSIPSYRMTLRSSVLAADVEDVNRIGRRSKNNSKINKRDAIVEQRQIDNDEIQVPRMTRSASKSKSASQTEVHEIISPKTHAECHGNKPIRRATRSNSTISQISSHELNSTPTKCTNDESIDRKHSLAAEKLSTDAFLDKSESKMDVSMLQVKSPEEIDSSYESSYSIDSIENSRIESTDVVNKVSLSNSLTSDDANTRNSSETSLNREQILYDLEVKRTDKNEKDSRSSSSTCSKEADDLHSSLSPGDVVWAKTKGYPWYPALMIANPCEPTDVPLSYFQNLNPPEVVSSLRSKFTMPVHLVRFFDKRKNWQWLPRNKLDVMGSNQKADNDKVGQVRRSNLRRDVKRAYDAALHHRKTNLKKFLGHVSGVVQKRLKVAKIRTRRKRERCRKNELDNNHVDDARNQEQKHQVFSDTSIDSVLNTRDTTEVLDHSSRTAAGSILNCSQQFHDPSFHSEKADREVNSSLKPVVPQNSKMLSNSL